MEYVAGFKVPKRNEPFGEVFPTVRLFRATDASGTLQFTTKLPNAGAFGSTTVGLTGFGSRFGVVELFGASGSFSPPPPWAQTMWLPPTAVNNNVAKRRG